MVETKIKYECEDTVFTLWHVSYVCQVYIGNYYDLFGSFSCAVANAVTDGNLVISILSTPNNN